MADQVEVKVTGGIGAYFWALIPGALGGGAMVWLAFVSGCMDIQQQRTFASRMDNRVGVVQKLVDPVRLKIVQTDCLKVDRAFIDGDTVTAYVKNDCHESVSYVAWYVNAASPDGTVIQSWFTNDPPTLLPDQTIEVSHEMKEDSRIVAITVYANHHP